MSWRIRCTLTVIGLLVLALTAASDGPEEKCKGKSCSGHGHCVPDSGKCECDHNFSGDDCEIDLCEDVHCGDHGLCYNGHCACDPGFNGLHCEIDICAGCKGNRVCSTNKDKCVCNIEFKEPDCITKKCDNYCAHDGSSCSIDPSGIPICNCTATIRYDGLKCELDLCDSFCKNGATCCVIKEQPGLKCVCPPGYSGKQCEINACNNVDCNGDNGKCFLESTGVPKCKCEPNYGGDHCKNDLCKDVTCVNGKCESGECFCTVGYLGQHCNQTVCDKVPGLCKDGTHCEVVNEHAKCHCNKNYTCGEGGSCIVIKNNTASCNCAEGFTGTPCVKKEADPCEGKKCTDDQECKVKENGSAQCVAKEAEYAKKPDGGADKQKDKKPIPTGDGYDESMASSFLPYFLVATVLTMVGCVVYHNGKKLIGLKRKSKENVFIIADREDLPLLNTFYK